MKGISTNALTPLEMPTRNGPPPPATIRRGTKSHAAWVDVASTSTPSRNTGIRCARSASPTAPNRRADVTSREGRTRGNRATNIANTAVATAYTGRTRPSPTHANSAPKATAPTPHPMLAHTRNAPYSVRRAGPSSVSASASVTAVCGPCAAPRTTAPDAIGRQPAIAEHQDIEGDERGSGDADDRVQPSQRRIPYRARRVAGLRVGHADSIAARRRVAVSGVLDRELRAHGDIRGTSGRRRLPVGSHGPRL